MSGIAFLTKAPTPFLRAPVPTRIQVQVNACCKGESKLESTQTTEHVKKWEILQSLKTRGTLGLSVLRAGRRVYQACAKWSWQSEGQGRSRGSEIRGEPQQMRESRRSESESESRRRGAHELCECESGWYATAAGQSQSGHSIGFGRLRAFLR